MDCRGMIVLKDQGREPEAMRFALSHPRMCNGIRATCLYWGQGVGPILPIWTLGYFTITPPNLSDNDDDNLVQYHFSICPTGCMTHKWWTQGTYVRGSNLGWAGPSSSCHVILVCVNYDLNSSLRINSRLHARLNNQISHPNHPILQPMTPKVNN